MPVLRSVAALVAAGAIGATGAGSVGATAIAAGSVAPVVRPAAAAEATDVARTSAGIATPVAPARPAARLDPSRLAGVGTARQAIVVTSAGWSSTRGTLRAWQKRPDGSWEVRLTVAAWLGGGGMARAERRRQGTGTTPAGTFAIPSAFGRRPDPGTRLPYLQFDRDDAWPYDPSDPATYNVFQHAPRWRRWDAGYVEHLWRLRDQYRYVAVLDYNLPDPPYVLQDNGVRTAPVPADTRRGGGIFLHVDDDRPTAGCIGVPLRTMRDILGWLDPAASPVLVAGPRRWLARG